MRIGALIAGLAALLLMAQAALADSWAPPSVRTYYSANNEFRFTVTPRGISNGLNYFSDLLADKPQPGQAAAAPRAPRGKLEQADGKGGWRPVWERDLLNDVGPVSAAISRDGAHVATFDDWHAVGTGAHVVVIYGQGGEAIRHFNLQDLLSKDYITALPRSVSSIGWGSEHQFSDHGATLVLKVKIPSDADNRHSDDDRFVDFRIDAATGAILTTDDPAWVEAQATAAITALAVKRAEVERLAFFVNPLVWPSTAGDREWHRAMREAFYRLDTDWQNSSAATKVLRHPGAADYAPSEGWLRDELLDSSPYAGNAMIASPASPENLLAVLGRIIPQSKPGAMKGRRFYIITPVNLHEQIRTLFASTGATLILVDPAIAIPQRPERLPR